MMNIVNARNGLPCFLLLAGASLLVGCEQSGPPGDLPETCKEDCNVEISLPKASDALPSLPDVVRVTADTEVNFNIEQRNNSGRTVLSFEQPAFIFGPNKPAYTLELHPGDNRFVTRPDSADACGPPDGCRFVVINVGEPGRPSIISSPYIIIEPR